MERTDDQLRSKIDLFETLAEWGGWLVVAGLVAEVALAYVFPIGNSVVERWGPVATNAFIALGVGGEVLFSRKARARTEELQRRSDEKIALLQADVAKANARAAEAEAETAKAHGRISQVHDEANYAQTLATAAFVGVGRGGPGW